MFHMCYLTFHAPSCAKPLTSTLSEHFTRPADEGAANLCIQGEKSFQSIPPDEQEHSTRLGEHFARPSEHSTRHSAVPMFT